MDDLPIAAPRFWVGVASQEHVDFGVARGFAQFCHGKAGPARRPRRGDWVIYYSAKLRFGEAGPCQRFTAFGRVLDDSPQLVEQAPGFTPWRRSIHWFPGRSADIHPLLHRLTFLTGHRSWGYAFRFGFLEIPAADGLVIARAMDVDLDPDDTVPQEEP